MPRTAKRKGIAKMRNVIAQRAGAFLHDAYAGPHRDKRIARDFNISLRMAQYLRSGYHWTTERLAQMSAMAGPAFDKALYTPVSSVQHFSEMGDLHDRLARLEAWREEVACRDDAGPPPPPRSEVGRSSGETSERDRSSDRGGSSP